jgi:hypothetical protein
MRLQGVEGQSSRKSHGGLKYRIIAVDLHHGFARGNRQRKPAAHIGCAKEIEEPS